MIVTCRDTTFTSYIGNSTMTIILAVLAIAGVSASRTYAGEAGGSWACANPDSTDIRPVSADGIHPLQEGMPFSELTTADSLTPDTAMVRTAEDDGHVLGQSLVFRTDPEADSSFAFDPMYTDSLPPPVKPRLLPENMSFMERGLWGESGILRDLGIASPLTPEVRKHELNVRRTMLTMHLIGGLVTLGSMVATVYYGQKYLDNGQRSDRDMHQTFAATTIASYSATALLAVLSPPPLIRREGETSTTTIHKTLAWIHAAGMIVTPLLGMAIHRRGTSYYDQARYHQISAYITSAVFAAAMIIITF
jgi:hypothetical protein